MFRASALISEITYIIRHIVWIPENAFGREAYSLKVIPGWWCKRWSLMLVLLKSISPRLFFSLTTFLPSKHTTHLKMRVTIKISIQCIKPVRSKLRIYILLYELWDTLLFQHFYKNGHSFFLFLFISTHFHHEKCTFYFIRFRFWRWKSIEMEKCKMHECPFQHLCMNNENI